jgi:hypothetical protein
MSNYTTLLKWLETAIGDKERGAEAALLQAFYKRHDGAPREVKTIQLKGKTFEIAGLSKTIQGVCETFAQDFPGLSQFEIQVHYGVGDAPAVHTITVMEGEMLQNGRGRTVKESNDAGGLVSQAMRHTEKMAEMLVGMISQGAVTSLQREQAAFASAEKLRAEVNDAYAIVREVLLSRNKEQHDMRMEELKFAKSLDERKRIMELMPALANTVSGREIFPQSVADTKLIEALATKVPPELLQQLASAGIVSPDVMGPLMARFEEVVRRKAEEEAALKKLPPMTDEPGMNAANGTVKSEA